MQTAKRIMNDANRIRSAYLLRTGGQTVMRVKLHHLRAALPDMDRAAFDAALLSLLESGAGCVYPLDLRRERTRDDEQAAFLYCGVPQHVLLMAR